MRIVFDLQAVQTSSRDRGIGRYSLSLAKAIARQSGRHEILIALNGALSASIEPIRAAFHGLVPQENIRVWQVAGPVAHRDASNDTRRRAAELVREAFLVSLNPDLVHVSSLFEGLEDDAVTSVGSFTSHIPTAVTLYDLIPYIYRVPYLSDPAVERWYEGKLDHLRRAGLLLAISESSRQEAVTHLGFDSESTINISAATESYFCPMALSAHEVGAIGGKYGLLRPFIMYTGGIDHRKNIEGLIEAYAGLPVDTRRAHQLAIVCAVQPASKARLEGLASSFGLSRDEVVITGFVPEQDLVALYNLCKLFVFPSWHEGFGLPALEAMRCGAPVIGANTSSLPEVIGREDALFDPHSQVSIRSKITQALEDDSFRADLVKSGLQQAANFSWDITAKCAIEAFEKLHGSRDRGQTASALKDEVFRRPTLAYVSPLPPARSGIASYSAELLPSLARHYRIIVISSQGPVVDPWVNANCLVHDPQWLRDHVNEVDRVLYHFGNSEFHEHMFDLLETVPGTVILHDFFLSGAQCYREDCGSAEHAWAKEIYRSHGYKALKDRYQAEKALGVQWKYPTNWTVLEQAQGVIVHSEASRRLAAQWYGESFPYDWQVVPLPRVSVSSIDRKGARSQLSLPIDGFVVCSFGLLGPTKLNHRVLSAWLVSRLARDPRCVLLFVGENDTSDYGRDLLRQIQSCGQGDRIRIVGWTDDADFRRYLSAADVGVQLRCLSRGEASAAVLDCMNYGLATIINAHGSMADIRSDSVWKLPDEFSDKELVEALEVLFDDVQKRNFLGENGHRLIKEHHDPAKCVDRYHEAIERFSRKERMGLGGLINALCTDEFTRQSDSDVKAVSNVIAANFDSLGPRQLLVDISALVQHDAESGIQRVVKKILGALIDSPPDGFRVEPVYASAERSGYFYARKFTSKWMKCPSAWSADAPIDAYPGDVFLGLDLQHHIVSTQMQCLDGLRNLGVKVCFVVYDLLPISYPECFVAVGVAEHGQWLNIISRYDKIIAISKAVADELVDWLNQHGTGRLRPLGIEWFHLGADFVDEEPDRADEDSTIMSLPASLNIRPSFLMVGTLEPRKGYAQVLDAFERLWSEGRDANLVLVGKQGWLVDGLVGRLGSHVEIGKRLFWMERIDDGQLKKLYSISSCLIAASIAEGFGLPLIEAAQHNLPIIARDIPVFKEVAGAHATYFSGIGPDDLARCIGDWLDLYGEGQHVRSNNMPWLTWSQSAKSLEQVVFSEECYMNWMAPSCSSP